MLRRHTQSSQGERRDLRGQARPGTSARAAVIARVLISLVIVALATAMAVPTVGALRGVDDMGKTPAASLSPDGSRLPPCSTGATPCVVP
jgi:hypothetical protein